MEFLPLISSLLHENAISVEVLPLMSSLLHENAITVDQSYAHYNLYCNHKGSRGGAVVRALASHQCGQGSIPGYGVISGLSLLLVLVLAPRVFLQVVRFSSFHKTQHF